MEDPLQLGHLDATIIGEAVQSRSKRKPETDEARIRAETNAKKEERLARGKAVDPGTSAPPPPPLAKEETMCQYFKFGPKSDHYRDDVFSHVIQSCEWQPAVEVGEKMDRLTPSCDTLGLTLCPCSRSSYFQCP